MLRRTFLATTAAAALASAKTQDRHIVLDGARNFRDIGGYPTRDGRRIRWGRIFRSDALHNLTESDYRKLAQLHIRMICDYRAKPEREREPTKWRARVSPEVQVLDIMAANPANAGIDPTASFVGRLTQPGMSLSQVSEMMASGMADMATTAGPLYGRMMRHVIDGDLPLLHHCSAGKDRTGLATALLMKVLDVEPDAILEDYLLVNKLVPSNAPEMAQRLSQQVGRTIEPKLLEPLLGTRREWLETAFQHIDRTYGSFGGYREQALLLTNRDVAQLRVRLLA